MIETANQTNSGSQTTEAFTKQLSIPVATLLHLLPGVFITIMFIILGPWLKENHLPPLLALLIPILFILIPFELGLLIILGFRRNRKLSLEWDCAQPRATYSEKTIFSLSPVPLFWAIVVIILSMTRVDQAISARIVWIGCPIGSRSTSLHRAITVDQY